MTSQIPESHMDLVEGPYLAIFTTLGPDGAPENTAVWCTWDGEFVIINTKEGRRKPRNVRRDPRVSIMILDRETDYRWIDIRGVVEALEPDPEYKTINALTKLYEGHDEFYGGYAPIERKGTEERITLKIRPQKVVAYPHKTHQ